MNDKEIIGSIYALYQATEAQLKTAEALNSRLEAAVSDFERRVWKGTGLVEKTAERAAEQARKQIVAHIAEDASKGTDAVRKDLSRSVAGAVEVLDDIKRQNLLVSLAAWAGASLILALSMILMFDLVTVVNADKTMIAIVFDPWIPF